LQWINEDPVYVLIRNELPAQYDTSGRQLKPKQRHVFAKFKRGIAEPYVLELALKTFDFRKKPTNVAAERWAAYYDSVEAQNEHGWTDEEREAIEDKLTNSGIGALLVERPKLAKPWATYDKLAVVGRRTAALVAEKVSEIVRTNGPVRLR
jgi:hypothetical protein